MNLCDELEAKSIKFLLLTTRYVNCLIYSGADPGFFLRRGCTRLLLYFNTNKPQFFFWRMPVVFLNRRSSQGGGGRTCTLPLDLPLLFVLCAVFHGATSMNNSQTLLLRFKSNIRSACTPAIPEDTET